MKYGKEILRSHWSGDSIETGHFYISQGTLSEGLVIMIMQLVSKYARSGNWASYTFRDDMESAAMLQLYDTALKFEEVKGNNVFAYLTQIASNRFTYILNTEKNQRKIKSKLMQQAVYNATYNEQVDFEMKLRAEELGLNDEEITLDYDDSNQD
jgi:DNA-directed RNA polymerase specialized sigma subunit